MLNYLQFCTYIPFPCNSCPYFFTSCYGFCHIDYQMIVAVEMGF